MIEFKKLTAQTTFQSLGLQYSWKDVLEGRGWGGGSSSVKKVSFSYFIFEVIGFDKLLAQKELNFLTELAIGCLLFSHWVKARECRLYIDSSYKYDFPFAYFRKHTTWSPINTMICIRWKPLFLCFTVIHL